MATIVTRSGKGSALTFVEADANFTNLNTDKIELTNISVGTEAAATGDGAIAYNNTTGVITYTPPTAAGIGALVAADAVLAGDLDVNDGIITNGVTDGNVTVQTNGSGKLVVDSDLLIKDGFIITSETDSDISIQIDGTGKVVFDGDIKLLDGFLITSETDSDVIIEPDGGSIFLNGAVKELVDEQTTGGTVAPAATDGTIQMITLNASLTINEFTDPVTGQTITLYIDGTGGSYTLTLGANILTPGGTLTLTDGGVDVVTITCLDDATPVYIATAVNDFQ